MSGIQPPSMASRPRRKMIATPPGRVEAYGVDEDGFVTLARDLEPPTHVRIDLPGAHPGSPNLLLLAPLDHATVFRADWTAEDDDIPPPPPATSGSSRLRRARQVTFDTVILVTISVLLTLLVLR